MEVCTLIESWIELATTLNHTDFVITLLIPFCLIVVLNTLISRTVWRVARVRRSMTKTTSAPHHHSMSRKGSNVVRPGGRTASSQTKVTEMLLVVSTVFICLNLPSYVIRVWLYVNQEVQNDPNMIILQHYFNLLFTTNFGINFALYCVSGQNFRRAIATMLCPNLRRKPDHTQVTVVSEYTRCASTRRTMTINGSWREAHEMIPINK